MFLRKFAARQIPVARVNLAEPSFVLPGTRADENTLIRERAQSSSQALLIEGRRRIE
jgi:hypothetical protein